jgi:ankyrin repeat protein
LHGAVSSGRIDIVQMLLAAGADPALRDYQGETPLDVARKKSPEIAELLKQHPSTPD